VYQSLLSLRSLYLPHSDNNRQPTKGYSKYPRQSPDKEPPNSRGSLQSYPYPQPRDRDLGTTVGPLPQQKKGRFRTPAPVPDPRRGPRSPEESPRRDNPRGMHPNLSKVQGKKEKAWPTRTSGAPGTNPPRERHPSHSTMERPGAQYRRESRGVLETKMATEPGGSSSHKTGGRRPTRSSIY
jgi:hypothetical protein